MKNNTTFVCMRSGDHLGDAKMSKRGISLRQTYLFNELRQTETVFAERKKKGRSTKLASNFLIFVPGLSYGLSKFSDDFTPFFFLIWKTITKSLGKN